jgi:hypothetical protein
MKTTLRNHKIIERTSSTQEANQEYSHICKLLLAAIGKQQKINQVVKQN